MKDTATTGFSTTSTTATMSPNFTIYSINAGSSVLELLVPLLQLQLQL